MMLDIWAACRAHPFRSTRLPNGMDLAYVSREDVAFLYQEIFLEEAYTQHGVKICCGDTVIDVGANLGLFSLWASRLVGKQVCASEITFLIHKYLLH